MLKDSDLLHQRRRKHGTRIPPPATFIIPPSIKHGCGLHWRRRGERRGQQPRKSRKGRKGERRRKRGKDKEEEEEEGKRRRTGRLLAACCNPE